MKTLLIVLALVVLAGVGFGFYRGWFDFSSDNADGNPSITVSVDKDKMEADKEIVVDKVQDLGDKAEDEAVPTPQTPPEGQTHPESQTPPEDQMHPEGQTPPEGQMHPE